MSSAVVGTPDLYQPQTSLEDGLSETNGTSNGSPASSESPSHHVGFTESDSSVFDSKERERYLTAKYPKHQMGLIRKRLAVEDWVDAELKALFDISEEDYDTYDTVIDLDELLNHDTEAERTQYIRQKISHAPKPEAVLTSISVFKQLLGNDLLIKTPGPVDVSTFSEFACEPLPPSNPRAPLPSISRRGHACRLNAKMLRN